FFSLTSLNSMMTLAVKKFTDFASHRVGQVKIWLIENGSGTSQPHPMKRNWQRWETIWWPESGMRGQAN
ncbi:hypothetical protein N8542_02955, partial [Verrucomicrobia bacterium]|nr:hypothetical protein [Verrucomicrobiota bacterium]